MSNKYKLECTLIDTDDEDPLSIEDMRSELIERFSESLLELEGEMSITKIEGD